MGENKLNDTANKSSNGFVKHNLELNGGNGFIIEANNKLFNGTITSNGKEAPPLKQFNGNIDEEMDRSGGDAISSKEPPDGGARSWIIMVSAFLCNGVTFGIINTYGIIYMLLVDQLSKQGDKQASAKAALVGSLTIGTTFLLSPVAGCLTDKIGLRLTTFIGGLLACSGLLISSFFTHNINVLYLSYGIMYGLGAALAYTPTLAILGHYFKRYLGKVSGFVTAGSSVFTIILPPTIDHMLKEYSLEFTLRVMSLLSVFIIICSIVYKPLHPRPVTPKHMPGTSRCKWIFQSIVNVEIWKNRKYLIWTLSVPLALFGYFVPYVHMVKFVKTRFTGHSVNLPVMCIGITSGLGRILFGAIADLPSCNRIYLQQFSLVCIGIVTLLLPLTSSYILLIIFTLIMGLFDGCFIALLGPIAYEICGASGATQAIGFMLGLSSIPLTVGPPIAGKFYDSLGSYTTPLILAGIPPMLGSSLMTFIRFVKDEEKQSSTASANKNNNNKSNDLNGISKKTEMNGHSITDSSTKNNLNTFTTDLVTDRTN